MLHAVEARKLDRISAELWAESWGWKSPDLPAEREWQPGLTAATGKAFPSGLPTCQLETRIAASRIMHVLTAGFIITVNMSFCYFGKLYFKDYMSRV